LGWQAFEGFQGKGAGSRLEAMLSRRETTGMDETKCASIYLEEDVHHALRLRAAACNRSRSDMVNEAVRITLSEAADD
jgi:hypothetical protein